VPDTTAPQGRPGDPYVAMLVDFARELRTAGLTIGSGDVLTYARSVATLDPTDLLDLYWAGRATLVTRHDQIAVYHRLFVRYFLDGPGEDDLPRPISAVARAQARAALEVPETQGLGDHHQEEQETRLGLVAADISVSRTKAFTACTPEELAALRRILRTMRLTPPRRRRTRQRPLTLILDVSGSMAEYSRNLVQFAHTSTRTTARTEVFCFGTRLTRVTRELDRRRPDEALDRAALAVTDWEGGTRIGASLDRFVRDWARGGLSRGGIVVICSDGLDRGDPDVLATAMEQLSRLCHRIVWLNPHKGDRKDFVPTTLGMMVAAPFVDEIVSGHDLASLEEFARVLSGMR
jgi:uncharacterized protein